MCILGGASWDELTNKGAVSRGLRGAVSLVAMLAESDLGGAP